jgi:hypothetical protein
VDVRPGAAEVRPVRIAPTFGLGQLPAGRGLDEDSAAPERELGIGEVLQALRADQAAERRREVRESGHPCEQLARNQGWPAPRGDDLERRAARARRTIAWPAGAFWIGNDLLIRGLLGMHELLGVVHEMRRDVLEAIALRADVEVPRRAPERGAVHSLLEVVNALERDGEIVVARERPEHVGRCHQHPLDGRRDLVAARHHLHGEGRAGQGLAQILQGRGSRHPGLVGEYRQPGVVEATDPAHLAVVAPGQDDEIARALGEESIEGVLPHADEGPPSRGPFRAGVEARQEIQELADLRLLGGVDDDLVAHQRVPLPQRERGVKMGRGEEHQGVHWPPWYGTVYDPGPMSHFRAGPRPPETSQNRR